MGCIPCRTLWSLDSAWSILKTWLLSRPKLRSPALRSVTTAYVSLMAAYGAINAAQDFWHEQIQKRNWIDWTFPKATEPTLTPVWLLILAGAAGIFVLLEQERPRNETGASQPVRADG